MIGHLDSSKQYRIIKKKDSVNYGKIGFIISYNNGWYMLKDLNGILINKSYHKVDLEQINDETNDETDEIFDLAYSYNKNKDFKKAAELYMKAADLGHSKSMTNLAHMYQHGTHPDGRNFKKAAELYEKAIKIGNSTSMNNLACMYRNGTHPDGRDFKKAVELYNRAIEKKNAMSVHNLAHMYQIGTHPDGRNIPKAIELHEKAITLGCFDALKQLEKMYENDEYEHEQYVKLYEQYGPTHKMKKPYVLEKVYQDMYKDICSICLDPLFGTKHSVHILACGHIFHGKCIRQKNDKCVFRC